MSDDPYRSSLSADRPETDPTRDALGFGPFSRQLARSIAAMVPEDGIVLAIYAPWGSGKSTVLNFVEHWLEQEPEETRPVVVRFNPWWFSGDEALARHFLGQIEALLSSKLKKLGRSFRGKLASLAETVSSMPAGKLVPVGGTNLEEAAKSVAAAAKGGTKDVVALKKEIGDALRAQERTILVVIDDIDRLTPEEVRQIFKLVKAVADFPRVVYLLAFDKRVVADALASQPGVDGEGYLEKIVQVPFELPVPDEQSLGTMLFARLNAVFRDVPQEEFDQAYWNNVFFDGLRQFLRTPRDVVRLTNSLAVTFPAVAGEVNAVDFIAVEALRVFEPGLYDFIRRNPDRFSGVRSPRESEADAAAFRERWIATVAAQRREHVEPLVARVFPNTGRTIYGASSESRWRVARRVCSREVFPAYFRLALPAGTATNAEMKEVLATVGVPERFAARLRESMARRVPGGGSAIRPLLDRLQDYTEEAIPEEALRPFAATLLALADEIESADDAPREMFDFGAGVQVGRLLWQAVRRMVPEDRYAFLLEQFSKGAALGTALSECVVLGQQQGRNGAREADPEEQWLVNAEQLSTLERAIVGRIRELAAGGGLLEQRRMPSLLHFWGEWTGSSEEARRWAEKALETDEAAARFVAHFAGESVGHAVGDYNVRREKTLDMDGLRELSDVDALCERLRSLNAEGLSEEQRQAVALFLAKYDAEKARGSVPSAQT